MSMSAAPWPALLITSLASQEVSGPCCHSAWRGGSVHQVPRQVCVMLTSSCLRRLGARLLLRFCLSLSGIEATICWWLRAAAQQTASEVGRKWLRAAARQGTECCSTVCMTVREEGLQHSKQDCEAARRCTGSSCLQGANSCSTAGLAGRLLDSKLALSKADLRLFIPAYHQITWGSCGPKGPQADSNAMGLDLQWSQLATVQDVSHALALCPRLLQMLTAAILAASALLSIPADTTPITCSTQHCSMSLGAPSTL